MNDHKNFGTGGLSTSVRKHREKYNKGRVICDLRCGYQLSKNVKVAGIVKNAFNVEYSERPAIIAPPRNFTLQLSAEF
jgi:outer membrane cobalamin receptor